MSVMLTSRDMKQSVRFYRDQLGFELKESWPDDKAPQWASLVLDGQSVMMGAAMDPAKVGEACHGDAEAGKYWRKAAEEFRANKPGVGIQVYLMVKDIDAYFGEIKERGVKVEGEPRTQFYGIRELRVDDPDGYRLVFFTPVSMSSCQSCSMPLKDAKPGQMYCGYCTDAAGKLLPYERVFEGTVSGYFMGMKKMPRPEAEKAAREHLAKMPAWSGH
jgi:uncharacterized glyoxalase superfamily protein PhnB